MEPLPDSIKDFLSANRIATVSFVDNKNKPYCFSCFFVFYESQVMLLFKSSYGTHHEDFTRFTTPVSGTILPEKLNLAKLKGIQFIGETVDESEISAGLLDSYYRKFPFGRVMGGYVWAINVTSIKFTDNTLVFGQKTIWDRKQITESPTQ